MAASAPTSTSLSLPAEPDLDVADVLRRLERLERVVVMLKREQERIGLRELDAPRATRDVPQLDAPASSATKRRAVLWQVVGGFVGAGRGWPGGDNEVAAAADALTVGGSIVGWVMGVLAMVLSAAGFRNVAWFARLVQDTTVAHGLLVALDTVIEVMGASDLAHLSPKNTESVQIWVVMLYVVFATCGCTKWTMAMTLASVAVGVQPGVTDASRSMPAMRITDTLAVVFLTNVFLWIVHANAKSTPAPAPEHGPGRARLLVSVAVRVSLLAAGVVVLKRKHEWDNEPRN